MEHTVSIKRLVQLTAVSSCSQVSVSEFQRVDQSSAGKPVCEK